MNAGNGLLSDTKLLRTETFVLKVKLSLPFSSMTNLFP